MVECSVCFDVTTGNVGPCEHPLCRSCACRWLKMHPICPYCRTDVHGAYGDTLVKDADADVVVICALGEPLRMTLVDTDGGVRVVHVGHTGRAYHSGLRYNDVLHSINNIPVTSHTQAMTILEASVKHCVPIACTVDQTRHRCCVFA